MPEEDIFGIEPTAPPKEQLSALKKKRRGLEDELNKEQRKANKVQKEMEQLTKHYASLGNEEPALSSSTSSSSSSSHRQSDDKEKNSLSSSGVREKGAAAAVMVPASRNRNMLSWNPRFWSCVRSSAPSWTRCRRLHSQETTSWPRSASGGGRKLRRSSRRHRTSCTGSKTKASRERHRHERNPVATRSLRLRLQPTYPRRISRGVRGRLARTTRVRLPQTQALTRRR